MSYRPSRGPAAPGIVFATARASALAGALACLLLFTVAPLLPGGDVETTLRGTSEEEIRGRLLADFGAVRAVAVDARTADGHARTIAGVSAGPLVFGPVARAGLHRLLAAPLDFGPASAVWSEPTALTLDTSIEPTARLGGGLSVFGGRLAAAGYEDGDGQTAALLAGSGRSGMAPPSGAPALTAEVLLSVSEAAPRPAGESWYPDEPGFPGGTLTHAAARIGAFRGPRGPGGTALTLHAVALGSAGRFTGPGGALTARAAAARESPRGPAVTLRLAGGVEQPDYRTAGGERPPEQARVAATLEVEAEGPAVRRAGAGGGGGAGGAGAAGGRGAGGGGEAGAAAGGMRGLRLTIAGEVSRDDRPTEIGARPPRERWLSAALELEGEAGAGIELHGAHEWLEEADGEALREAELAAAAGLRGERAAVRLEAERDWEVPEYEDSLRLQWHVGGAAAPLGLRVEQWLRLSWPEGIGGRGARGAPTRGAPGGDATAPPRLEGAAGVGIRAGRLSLSVRAQTDGAVELSAAGRREAERDWEVPEYEDSLRLKWHVGGAAAPLGLRVEQWLRLSWPEGIGGRGARGAPARGAPGGGATAPARLEGAAGVGIRAGRLSLSVRAQTDRAVELSAAGRREAAAAPWEHIVLRVEGRVRVSVPDLHAEDESGYLEVYGKPDHVDDGGHEGAGHDGGVEPEAMDEQGRDDPDDG